jgi:hypothetical protein
MARAVQPALQTPRFIMSRSVFAFIALSLAVVGCASSPDAATDTSEALAPGRTLEGGFTAKIDGHSVRFDYELSNIDFSSKTVVWNAKLIANGGLTAATDDVNVRGAITAVARCAGCFNAEVPGGSGHPLAAITVSDWKVVDLTYEGAKATLSEASEGGESGASAASDAPPSNFDRGSCTQTCSGNATCKANVMRIECASGTGLFPVMRCPTTFEFKKDGDCR